MRSLTGLIGNIHRHPLCADPTARGGSSPAHYTEAKTRCAISAVQRRRRRRRFALSVRRRRQCVCVIIEIRRPPTCLCVATADDYFFFILYLFTVRRSDSGSRSVCLPVCSLTRYTRSRSFIKSLYRRRRSSQLIVPIICN